QTLDGQRVWDIRRAVQALAARPEYRGLPIVLQAKGDMAGPALYAALFEPAVTELELSDLSRSHRQGPILLHVRRHLDVPQAVVLAFPRRITLTGKDARTGKPWEWAQQFQALLGKNYLKIN